MNIIYVYIYIYERIIFITSDSVNVLINKAPSKVLGRQYNWSCISEIVGEITNVKFGMFKAL